MLTLRDTREHYTDYGTDDDRPPKKKQPRPAAPDYTDYADWPPHIPARRNKAAEQYRKAA